jgi:hypothetical protein
MLRPIHRAKRPHAIPAVFILPPLVALLAIVGVGIMSVPVFGATETGDLQIVVRDGEGQRLPEVHLLLYHDADSGPEMLQHVQTDHTGRFPSPAWPTASISSSFMGRFPAAVRSSRLHNRMPHARWTVVVRSTASASAWRSRTSPNSSS